MVLQIQKTKMNDAFETRSNIVPFGIIAKNIWQEQ